MRQSEISSLADTRLGLDLLWRDVRVARFSSSKRALFLDRDGVIIEEKEYISHADQVELLPFIADLIRAAREAEMAVVEVTNQSGIGRGYTNWQSFIEVQNRTCELLAELGARLDAVFACPFHSEACSPYGVSEHPWRKPHPGMLLEAAHLLNLDLPRSLLVGDKIADQDAARSAGLAGGIHVLTGHGREHELAARSMSFEEFPIRIAPSAREAALMLKQVVFAETRRSSKNNDPGYESPDRDPPRAEV